MKYSVLTTENTAFHGVFYFYHRLHGLTQIIYMSQLICVNPCNLWCISMVPSVLLCGDYSLAVRYQQYEQGAAQAGIERPARHFLDRCQRSLYLHLAFGGECGHLFGFQAALALIHHTLDGARVAGGRFGREQVCVVCQCQTGDVVLLAVLHHVGVEGCADGGPQHHAYGEHDADPRGQVAVGHALVGQYGGERVEQHHARSTDDDGVLHAFVQAGGLYLEVHEQGRQTDEDKAQGEEILQVYAPLAQRDGYDGSDEVAQDGPVVQCGVLPVVYLHAHTGKHIDEQGAGVQHHQQQEEDDAQVDGAQAEHVHQEIGRAVRGLHIEEQAGEQEGGRRGPADGGVVIPVEHLAIDQHIDHRRAHGTEDDHAAELAEVDGEAAAGIAVVGHGDEDDEDGNQRGGHHVVIDVLPFVLVGQPGGERGTYLSQYHEEQVDGGHADALLAVQSVPSFGIAGLIAGRDVAGGLHAEGILDEGKEVHHHQHHAQEAHDEAAQGQEEDAVGLGAHVAQGVHHGKPAEAHHLLAADAHQFIEEGREGCHADGGEEADKLDVLRLDAQSAHHLPAVGGIDTAYGEDGDEEQHQYQDAQRFGHPIVERIVFGIGSHRKNEK